MAMMPGSAYKARQDMISRMKSNWRQDNKDKAPGAPQYRQDHVEPARSAKEARDNMIARMTGKPTIKTGTGAYREDSADPTFDSKFDRIFDRAWDNVYQER